MRRVALLAAIVACRSGGSGEVPPPPADAGPDLCASGLPYPNGPYDTAVNATVPDLTFDVLADDGSPAKRALHEYFEPCAAASRVLVVRYGAGWCGTCRWHQAHTSEIAGPRVELFDLELANDDGMPPQPGDVAIYKKRIDANGVAGADPKYRLGAAGPLPFYVLIDTKTMVVLATLANPDPDTLAPRLGTANAPPALSDGLFTRDAWDELHDMKAPDAPPKDPSNAHADDPAAAALGKKLFGDAGFSFNGAVSCATCHDPAKQWADGLPVSAGVGTGDRNAPSIALAAHARWQFWDGRADNLWSQPLAHIEDVHEYASSRLVVAHGIFDRYNAEYTAVFGALPALGDAARFPPAGAPGNTTWESMTNDDKNAATQVFVNFGKAIAAYERTIRVKPNRLDAYIGGDLGALTPEEKNGLLTFFKVGCAQCHWGPRMTDDAFHATRFPTGRRDGRADPGRADADGLLLQSDFLAAGRWSDDPDAGHGLALSTDPTMVGAFKTPSLRGVPRSAPYGHGGKLATLDLVTKLYAQGGLPPADPTTAGAAPRWLAPFDASAQQALVPFLNVLTADPP
jgi:cytochrome c peroxidase